MQESAVIQWWRRGCASRAGQALRDHPYAAVFAVAFVARATVAVFVFVRFQGTLFLDDATYSDLAAQRAAGATAAWDAYTHFLYERTATMLIPMTWLYDVFGPHRLLGQLLVACMGAATAALSAMIARRGAGLGAALFAGFGVALMPSQVIFSATTMKDAFVWCLLSCLAAVALQFGDTTGRKLILVAGAAFTALTLLGYLRLHTQAVAVLALVGCALLFRSRAPRRWIVACALVAGLIAPWVAGSGPGAFNLLTAGADADYLAGLREAQAVGNSALDVTDEPEPSTQAPDSADENQPGAPEQAAPGAGSTTVDETGSATLSYLPRGIVAVLLGPAPWQSGSAAFRFAGIENLLWYALLVLVVIGLPRAWRHREAALFPAVVATGCLLMWALVEGNAGTAFRHRGEFVWAGWVLASFGVATILSWRSDRAVADADPPREADGDVVAVGPASGRTVS